MVRARLLCSGEECAEVFEAVGRLEEIEALACECGCSLELLGWPEAEDGDRETLVLELAA